MVRGENNTVGNYHADRRVDILTLAAGKGVNCCIIYTLFGQPSNCGES